MQRMFPSNRFVPPRMRDGSVRLAIGEAPGADEERLGEGFVGSSGRVLNYLYSLCGVQRSQISTANIINCRPPKNIFPLAPEARSYITLEDAHTAVQQCWTNHVLPVLESRQWQRVDLLGVHALQVGTGRSGIQDWAGTPLVMPYAPQLGRVAIATLHPAFLMREQRMWPAVLSDLKRPLAIAPENYILQAGLPEMQSLLGSEVLSLDLETNTAEPPLRDIEIRLLGLTDKKFEGLCTTWGEQQRQLLQRLINNTKTLVGQNCLQFDLPLLEREGIRLPQDMVVFDTMLVHHLLWPTLPHDLGFLGRIYTQKPFWKNWREAGDPEELYCARDVDGTLQIYEKLRPEIERDQRLWRLYRETQVPLARICHTMTERGILRDPQAVAKVRERVQQDMDAEELLLPEELRTRRAWRNRLHDAPPGTLSAKTGKPLKKIKVPEQYAVVPWRSTDEIKHFLFETRAYPVQLDPKTGRASTGKEALERLINRNPSDKALTALRNLRKMEELTGTFCKELEIGSERLHPSFNVQGTATGRLSSSGPNLQNFPESARVIFIPSDPEYDWLSVDFSQIENRLTAWFAQDTDRLARFDQPGFSEHKYAASKFFGIPMRQVKKDNSKDAPYGKAKRIVHGVNYTAGAKKISQMYDMDYREVCELLARWKAEIPKTIEWQERIGNQAKQLKQLYNPFGRKGLFYDKKAYSAGVAFLPQSTAADVIFQCMIALMYERINWPAPANRVHWALPPYAHLVLQVHDQLLFEVHKERLREVAQGVQRVMEQPWPELEGLRIPVALETGSNWGEMREL